MVLINKYDLTLIGNGTAATSEIISVEELSMTVWDSGRKKLKYICNLCRNEYLLLSSLKRHLAERHGDEAKFICGKCGRGFMRREHLTRHMATVVGCCEGGWK